jgi:catechol 2,3-dioxygenase-like lactoylglutathione lyase family enzyme
LIEKAHLGVPTRRQFIAGAAAMPIVAGAWNSAFAAQLVGDELPLHTRGLEHLGLVAADVTHSARFYCGVFGHGLFREIDPPLRYYVMIGKAYIAIGAREGVAPKLDHYCVTLDAYDREKMDARISGLGYRALPRGLALDPDGIGLQLLEHPAGLTDTNIPADRLLRRGYGLVQAYGLDHVVVRVSNFEKALPFYDGFFARTASGARDEVWYRAADTTVRVSLQDAGKSPAFESYAVRVGPFDPGAVREGIQSLGGQVEPGDTGGHLRFSDPDGLKVELVRA